MTPAPKQTVAIRRAPIAFALGALLLAGGAEAATVLCVATSAQLRSASSQANLTDDDVEIRLRNGVYATGGTRFNFLVRTGFTTQVSGGWNASCTTQSQNPQATLLDGQLLNTVMFVSGEQTLPAGSFALSNLGITGGRTNSGPAGCLTISVEFGTPAVILDRLVVSGCDNQFGAGGGIQLSTRTASVIYLRNSLISDSIGTQNGGGGVAVDSAHASANTFITNNTIVGNRSRQSVAGGFVRTPGSNSAGTVFLRNNAIVGNFNSSGDPDDIEFRSGSAAENQLQNNAFAELFGSNFTASGSVETSTPRFVGAGNYALRADSALRNAGIAVNTILAGTHDLSFSTRFRESSLDIGAYEYEGLLRSGFE